jgi:manganese/zinc/iron transport system permease protein
MGYSFLDFFTDPVLQPSMLATIFMALSSSLVGTVVFIQKRSLISETLAHASYPGVTVGALILSFFIPAHSELFSILILVFAFFFAVLALALTEWMQRNGKQSPDAALCFTLSSFFGVGILIASKLQSTSALFYKQAQLFLYGQAATLLDVHVFIYMVLWLVLVGALILFFRPLCVSLFDRPFAASIGLSLRSVDVFLTVSIALATVIGIRSVGVVMMAGMMVAPALAARLWTKRILSMLALASIFGVISAVAGCYLSVMLPLWKEASSLSLPTGPMILLVAAAIAFFSMLFAVEQGALTRWLRVQFFRCKCLAENILKAVYKGHLHPSFSRKDVMHCFNAGYLITMFVLYTLRRQGWLLQEKQGYTLTVGGEAKALGVIRLHRLWEMYLVDRGHAKDRVHHLAEHMEHVITEEMEEKLTLYLNDPLLDPHNQPIPKKRGQPC